MQCKANNFHTFSILSPCDYSLQATDVWHCDGMTQPFTLLQSTALQQVQKNPNQTTITKKRNQKRTQVF